MDLKVPVLFVDADRSKVRQKKDNAQEKADLVNSFQSKRKRKLVTDFTA